MSTHRFAIAMKNAPKIVTPITDGKSLRKIDVMAYWPIPGRLKIVSVMNDPARTPARSSPNIVTTGVSAARRPFR
jgi:hypothetical protein